MKEKSEGKNRRKWWTLDETLALVSAMKEKRSCSKAACLKHGVDRGLDAIKRRWKAIDHEYKAVRRWETSGQATSYFDMNNRERKQNALPVSLHKDIYDELLQYHSQRKPLEPVGNVCNTAVEDSGEEVENEIMRLLAEDSQDEGDHVPLASADEEGLSVSDKPAGFSENVLNSDHGLPESDTGSEETLSPGETDEATFVDGLLLSEELQDDVNEGSNLNAIAEEQLPHSLKRSKAEPDCNGQAKADKCMADLQQVEEANGTTMQAALLHQRKTDSWRPLDQQKTELLLKANTAFVVVINRLASAVQELAERLA